ncbi:hypothetical protein Salat_1423500 [Sesamum alatum]|uniref:DUF4216 domain-containing protein n=1 Tax=Sesamum alatum TaxID=300844 RepID=A0AAE1YAC8_9LAMI|nr:hypothetical protein Salat_1423500 [Sesamum alatum]
MMEIITWVGGYTEEHGVSLIKIIIEDSSICAIKHRFSCTISRGLKQDDFKFTLVNFNHLMKNKNLPTDEPFVLASQVQQVWYISDPSEAGWHVVATMTRKYNYDVYSTIKAEPHSMVELDNNIHSRNEDVCWVREGVEGLFVDETMTTVEDVEVGNDIEIEDDFDVRWIVISL